MPSGGFKKFVLCPLTYSVVSLGYQEDKRDDLWCRVSGKVTE